MAEPQRLVRELVYTGPPERLDRWLARELGLSRAAVQRAIDEGRVTVEGAVASKSLVPGEGAWICVREPETEATLAALLTVPVLYADEHVAFVDKPAGMLVYSSARGKRRVTLADALRGQFPQLALLAAPEARRPGIVHRLDAETSGVMVIGLNEAAVRALQRQFRRRQTAKTYLALAHGHVLPERAMIEAPIGRQAHDRTRMSVRPDGRDAQTIYRLIEPLRDASLLEVDLLTGRTHQIRVHLASIGHPVIGDRVYGRRRRLPGVSRQMLHAWRLQVIHPATGSTIEVEAPIPADMAAAIESLRQVGGVTS